MSNLEDSIKKLPNINELEIEIEDLSKCYYCLYPSIPISEAKCPNCHFPQRGSEYAMKQFLWKKRDEDQSKLHTEKDYDKNIRISLWIYVFLAFVLFAGIFFTVDYYTYPIIISLKFILAFIFVVAIGTVKFLPRITALVTTVSFFLFQFLLFLLQPEYLFNGMIYKFCIIICLIFTLKSAFSVPLNSKKYKDLNLLDQDI